MDVGDAQAVWLKDKVYVGGGMKSGNMNLIPDARLYIYTPATDEWTTLDTPVFWFGLTTYHSQLVGGTPSRYPCLKSLHFLLLVHTKKCGRGSFNFLSIMPTQH